MKCSLQLSLIVAMVISSLAPILTFSRSLPWKLLLSDEVDVIFRRPKNERKTTQGVGANSGRNGNDPPARALVRQPAAAVEPTVLNNVEGGAAACLLIKDENHRLGEWIAYHYHTLPLRHLIVAVDSTSVTSPSSILDRWRTSAGMMDIVEWRDGDYMYAPMEDDEPLLSRQRFFIPACAAYHRAKRRSWVFLHDVDEYISFNSLASDELHLLDEIQGKLGERTRSNLLHEKEGEASSDLNSASLRNQRIMARGQLPEVGNTTVLDFLDKSRDGALWRNDTCITIPRLFFSAVESGLEEISRAHADLLGFNATDFNTLRFFHHAEKGSFEFNKWGKVAIDVSRIHMQMFLGKIIQNPHKPFDACKSPLAPYETSFLRCNHYMSSWDAYSFKNDSRRTRDEYERVANISSGTIYDMQPWLYSFVHAVGYEKAHYLLHDAGTFEEHKLPNVGDGVN